MAAMLFVQVGATSPIAVNAAVYSSAKPGMVEVAGHWLTAKAVRVAEAAAAWWLVDCESADAGRVVIAEDCGSSWVTVRFGAGLTRGRVIASGAGRVTS